MQNKCDLCGKTNLKVIVDGKVGPYGGWAWMCEKCHKQLGVGFGLGRGQLFDTAAEKKLKG